MQAVGECKTFPWKCRRSQLRRVPATLEDTSPARRLRAKQCGSVDKDKLGVCAKKKDPSTQHASDLNVSKQCVSSMMQFLVLFLQRTAVHSARCYKIIQK
jgi:hypothetical protein